mgnify:FL=1
MIYKCKMCKGDLQIIDEENGLCECEYCGSRQTVPLENNERKAELYNRANQYRKNNLFDRAADVYNSMVKEFPNEAEAYWGLVLCRYGIEYVEDPGTKKMIPTCHRTVPKPIFEDSDYQLACQKAKPMARKQHEEEAAEIAKLQKKIFQLVQKEEPFDIFISYKELEEGSSQRTEDSVIAQDIYSRLTQEGYKVFFSRITLENRLGEDYEPIIYSALRSSRIMLLVGTSREHMNAPWVRNEWMRYLAMMDEEENKKTLIPVYAGMDPYDIPQEINGRHLQAQDATKIGFQQDLLHGIHKIMNSNRKKVAPVSAAAGMGNINTGGMIERGYICLQDRNFNEANEVFNQVLNVDPHSGGAYLGRLMIKRGVTDIDDLEKETYALSDEADYRHAIEYGEPQIKKKLKAFNQKIIHENKEYAQYVIQNKIDAMNKVVEEERQHILMLQNEISAFAENIQSNQEILDKSTKALAAGKVAGYGVMTLFLLLLLPWTCGFWLSGDTADGIFAIILMVVLYKFVVKKFLIPIARKIAEGCMGKPKEDSITASMAAISYAGEMTNEHRNEIEEIHKNVTWMEGQMQSLKNNSEEVSEHLSMMRRSSMQDELDRMSF